MYMGTEGRLLSTADMYMGTEGRLLSTADMFMGTEDRLLSTADICLCTQQTGWSYFYTAARVLKAWCLIEHRVNMTLAKVMNKLLMTNLIKFAPLNLSIQNKYLYGSVQHSFILFSSHTFQSKSTIIRL
jgi:hypothetical protein